MDIFELHDPVWKVWVTGPKTESNRSWALRQYCVGVKSELEAMRLLKSLPAEVEVHESDLDDFETYFETQTIFHHERVIGDILMANRPVWVTLRRHDTDPTPYWDMAEQLLMDRRFVKALDDCIIHLKDGAIITFDKEPING